MAHSHGGQIALLAAAQLPMRSLIMVGTPVRRSIETTVAPLAVPNLGSCLHVSDPRWDLMGLAGALMDGRLSLRRTFNVPGIRCDQPAGIGHSQLLCDPRKFSLWKERGYLNLLAGGSVATGV